MADFLTKPYKSAPKFFEMRSKIMNEPASGPRTWRAHADAGADGQPQPPPLPSPPRDTTTMDKYEHAVHEQPGVPPRRLRQRPAA